MDNVNGQLQTKYQKIATEYSKIRAQASVLKKAVIEEQTRNGEIREQLKEKELELRRAEQELDSLNFRNQQLTKRVTVLQEELENSLKKTKKSIRSKSSEKDAKATTQLPSSTSQQNHILNEEFQKKIIENAQLVSQISDKDVEIDELNERLEQLRCKLEDNERLRVDIESNYIKTLDKVERERNDLQRKLLINERQNKEDNSSWCEVRKDGFEDYQKTGGTISISPSSSPVSSKSSMIIDDQQQSAITKLTKAAALPSDDDSLNQDLQLINKIYKLEKDLSHYKTEYHIVKMRCDELEKHSQNNALPNNVSSKTVEINNMLGSMEAPFIVPQEVEAREARIKDYFKRELSKLIAEKEMYHVKNLAMAADAEVTKVHLTMSEEQRERSDALLQATISKWSNLKEDQEVQEGNYKSQLSTMSEHLANMNEKLITQTEEIQQLKYELGNKKKGKQK